MRPSAAVRSSLQEANLAPDRMPRHVAIIMDGNGRWARRRGFLRRQGHRQGAETVRQITTESVRLGIERLTLYAFSSENWTRPAAEVECLMTLLDDFLAGELPTLMEHHVRLEAIGHLDRLPSTVRATLDRVRDVSAGNRAMTLCLALSYGGRDEIVDACTTLAIQVRDGVLDPSTIDEATLTRALYAPVAGDVDLLIRTAGEQRLSNFLPWQSVYAEFVFLPMHWPDMTVADYHGALREYQHRERRFGAVDED